MSKPLYGMVQVNDGSISVTVYATEEEAYADIVDTCLQAPEWIDLAEDDFELKLLRDLCPLISAKAAYEKHIRDALEGLRNGFWMEVVELGSPTGQLLLKAKSKPRRTKHKPR